MRLIGLDLETTSKEPGARPVEIAAVEVTAGACLTLLDEHCDPGMPIPAQSTLIHGFEDADRFTAHGLQDAIEMLIAVLPPPEAGDFALVIHNAPYDCGVLTWAAAHCGVMLPDWPVICSLEVARAHRGPKGGNALDRLCEEFGLERPGGGHRAYGDAWAAVEVFRRFPVDPVAALARPFSAWAADWDGAYTLDFPAGFEALPDLVDLGGGLTFDYRDAKGNESSRTITPHGWAMRGGVLHFHGFCHKEQDARAFRADRVVAVLGSTL